MPNLQVRGLGKVGVVTDMTPMEAPLEAWSSARNLRFATDAATRASVFKPFVISPSFAASDPLLVVDDSLRSSTKSISTLRKDGTITRVREGAVSDVSPAPPIAEIIGNPTTTTIGSVVYVNAPNSAPISFAFGESVYTSIPNWDAGTTCRSFRKYRDFAIALNVTKATTEFPNMIKWSDAIQAGTRPLWDTAAANSLAGENVLNDSTGYIVDGMELGGFFMVYGTKEVWRMSYIGEPLVFSFDKVFNDVRIMTQNCVAETGSKHFLFCEDDILVTDGITAESVCGGKVRSRIFSALDYASRDQCRVVHNTARGEILFCYPTLHSDAAWAPSGIGCNEAAVFNYIRGTWSFVDLPNVTSGVEATHPVGAQAAASAWEGLANWSDVKSPWTFAQASPMSLIVSSASGGPLNKQGSIYFYDDAFGGRIGNAADPELHWEAWGELRLRDFDTLGLPLNTLKLVSEISPQVLVYDQAQSVGITIVGDMTLSTNYAWPEPTQFNPDTQVKLNCHETGRYISIRYTIPAGGSAELVGFDLNLTKIAGR